VSDEEDTMQSIIENTAEENQLIHPKLIREDISEQDIDLESEDQEYISKVEGQENLEAENNDDRDADGNAAEEEDKDDDDQMSDHADDDENDDDDKLLQNEEDVQNGRTGDKNKKQNEKNANS
jgi:hypothetical protein